MCWSKIYLTNSTRYHRSTPTNCGIWRGWNFIDWGYNKTSGRRHGNPSCNWVVAWECPSIWWCCEFLIKRGGLVILIRCGVKFETQSSSYFTSRFMSKILLEDRHIFVIDCKQSAKSINWQCLPSKRYRSLWFHAKNEVLCRVISILFFYSLKF